MEISSTTPLDLALAYRAAHWPVFPCRDAETADEHGELHAPKTPLTSNGLKGATKVERVVRELWRRHPSAMVGVPTGEAIGAFVLDVDIKEKDDGTVVNGHESLAALIEKHGRLPDTATVATPRGGRHYYFTHVPYLRNTADKVGPALDTRATGGFVIAAGSKMADGRGYEWLDHDGPGIPPIADAPEWLLALLKPKPAPAPTPYTHTSRDNTPYINAAMDAELSLLASTTQGGRGEQVNKSAFVLGTLVGAQAVSREDAEHGLMQAAVSNGVVAKDGEAEIRRKIKRGLDAGSRQPRHIPESTMDDTPLVDTSRLVARAAKKGEDNVAAETTGELVGRTAYASEREIQSRDDGTSSPMASVEDVKPQPEQQTTGPFTVTPFTWVDPKSLPRREFAYGSHYIRKYVSVTVSPGGLGKTSNSIAEALAMASGRALLGIKPPKRLKVFLFNAEDPREEMERRIMAACIHYGLKPKDIEGHLFLDTGREQELVVAIEDKRTGVRIIEPLVNAVVEQVEANGIDVMIVDPFVSTHQVNENDNGAIDKVAKLWAQIAHVTDTAVDIVHHLRKVADREATVEDARGAVSLIGAARSVRVLNRMSEEQAATAGISGQERFSYFNIHQGKANLSKMSGAQDWRKLESVPLGNGRGLDKPQDHAGVVTEWKWPDKTEMAEAVPIDKTELIKVRVRSSDYTYNYQSSQWVGRVVADIIGIDLPEGKRKTAEHTKIERLVDGWIESGVLYKDKVKGLDIKHIDRETTFVRVA